GGRCCGGGAAEAVAWLGWLADRAESRAVGQDCKRRGRSADAGACGTSVADDDGQARRRPAELRVVQKGAGEIVGWVERSETHPTGIALTLVVIARSASDEAIHLSLCRAMDCFASLAMTGIERRDPYRPSHFGGRFSANAFGPSM